MFHGNSPFDEPSRQLKAVDRRDTGPRRPWDGELVSGRARANRIDDARGDLDAVRRQFDLSALTRFEHERETYDGKAGEEDAGAEYTDQ
jgi:hypothetical protein